jgi:hypothetical protein
MRVVVHLAKFYDWVPVPPDVKVAEADVKADRVKPAADGGWLMKVTKEADTYTTVLLPEHQIVAKIIDEKTRSSGGRTLSRKQAVGFYLSEHVMPQHAHRTWIKGFEVHDDGRLCLRIRFHPAIRSDARQFPCCGESRGASQRGSSRL